MSDVSKLKLLAISRGYDSKPFLDQITTLETLKTLLRDETLTLDDISIDKANSMDELGGIVDKLLEFRSVIFLDNITQKTTIEKLADSIYIKDGCILVDRLSKQVFFYDEANKIFI